MASSRKVIPTTGVARTWMMLVAYIDQMKSGIRCHVIPGARSLWIVTRKFRPVRMEDIPMRKIPKERTVTSAEVLAEYGV